MWSTEPLVCQHTACPWVIVTWLDEKVFELVAFTLAAAPLEPHELATLVELPPHAVMSAPTTTLLISSARLGFSATRSASICRTHAALVAPATSARREPQSGVPGSREAS